MITENARAVQAATALETRHLEVLREVLAASHRSLRDDYEVSCRELDIIGGTGQSTNGCFRSADDRGRIWGLHYEFGKRS